MAKTFRYLVGGWLVLAGAGAGTIAVAAPVPAPVTPTPTAEALDQVSSYSGEGRLGLSPAQVTSVSQLSDVKPTDWAFQALQSLVERYGVIVGYPDRTYRGNRALTRYEFAAGLNAALDRVNELLASSTADLVKKEDLATLQKLQEQFASELAALRGRVDALEARTAKLEKQQFSTTTKLNGEVIFNVAGVLGGDRALNSDQQRTVNAGGADPRGANRSIQDNTIFTDRVRLNFDTSFTGKDRLRTRLEANNTTAFNAGVTGTNQTRLVFDSTNNVDNSLQIGKLFYRFPVGKNLTVVVDAIGGEFYDNVNTFNPFLTAGGTGTISRFGRFNPIYRLSNTGSATNTGAGVSAVYRLSDNFVVSGGYLARRPNDPGVDRGLFNGTYAALGQIEFNPSKDLSLGFTYVHGYYSAEAGDVNTSGSTGSAFASAPFGAGVPTTVNSYGAQASYRFSPGFNVSGWVGYTAATAERRAAGIFTGGDASIWNWSVQLAFPDLGKKGNLAGIIVGVPPKVTSNDYALGTARRRDRDTSFHVEGLYRYQLNNNLSITPGVIVIFNPEHNSANDTQVVGVIRTTFVF